MNNVINFIAFQLIWLIAVVGASHQIQWPCLIAVILFCIWQLSPKRRHQTDIGLIIFALIIGTMLDSLWQGLNLIQFELQMAMLPPLWILLLWITLALSINHSLSWLNKSPWFPLLFGAIGAPLSYYAGHRIGAVDFPSGFVSFCIAISLSWSIVMCIFVNFEQIVRKPKLVIKS